MYNNKYTNNKYTNDKYRNEYTLLGSIEDMLKMLKDKYDIIFNTNNKEAIIEYLRTECGHFISEEQEKEFLNSDYKIN